MVCIVPRNGDVEHILQYHCVGLDKITESDSVANGSETEATDTTSSTNNPLNDEVIAVGDELNRQITGGPQANMMSLENLKTFSQTVSIAPAEGQKSLSIMTDTDFEAMVNPDKFCFGKGTFN